MLSCHTLSTLKYIEYVGKKAEMSLILRSSDGYNTEKDTPQRHSKEKPYNKQPTEMNRNV